MAKKIIWSATFILLLLTIVFVEASDDITTPVCQGKCEEFADCNEFCKRIGFKSGQCVPPFEQFCCCM
ncbi:unnamed protein product [Withania somnifera]